MEADQLRGIVASAQAGDSEGYRLLLEAYGPRLFGYFLRATGSRHDAEDLLGELMLRLVRQLKNYVHQDRFDPWLFRIAANMVRDRIRRRRTAGRFVRASGDDEQQADPVEQLPANDPPVEAAMQAEEMSAKLNTALGRLDEATRQMILLRHFGQMSFKEMARVFDCPLGTVLARVHRGLGALRKWLQGHEEP